MPPRNLELRAEAFASSSITAWRRTHPQRPRRRCARHAAPLFFLVIFSANTNQRARTTSCAAAATCCPYEDSTEI